MIKLPLTEKLLWKLYALNEEISSDIEKFMNTPLGCGLKYPNLKHNLKREYIDKIYESKINKRKFQKTISYLKQKGWIKIEEVKNKKAFFITTKGQEKVSKIIEKTEFDNLKKRRDKRWQMIMYDIPKTESIKRFNLRRSLKLLGYKMIQKSVWASPYNVLEETKLLIEKYQLQDFARLLLVEEIKIN